LNKSIFICAGALAGSIFLVGCNRTESATVNANNANTDTATATTTTRPGPDNSEITTVTDANGVKTETRTFRDNTHVSKLVVTTRGGTRSTRVYSRGGEEKELSEGESENVLEKSGDAVAGAAGFVADKTVEGSKKGVEVGKTVGDKTVEGAKKVGDKTADTAKTVGDKTADTSKTVAHKTAEGAKTVGEKTASGAKKAGKAIKRVVSP